MFPSLLRYPAPIPLHLEFLLVNHFLVLVLVNRKPSNSVCNPFKPVSIPTRESKNAPLPVPNQSRNSLIPPPSFSLVTLEISSVRNPPSTPSSTPSSTPRNIRNGDTPA